MATEKQILVNQKNAKLSTGPCSALGKKAIAKNAMKHAIFSKELFSLSDKESPIEYEQLLSDLAASLRPQNQMESCLVEKIAVDFWRLRRVLRFETGSMLKKYQSFLSQELYPHGRKDNIGLQKEIQKKEEALNWIEAYMECLKKREVDFDEPIWEGESIESDITEDFWFILNHIRKRVLQEDASFDDLKIILEGEGYSSKESISLKLLEVYGQEEAKIRNGIKELEDRQKENLEKEKLYSMLSSLPDEDSADKVLKYERSLQKSIFQNIFLLRKIRGE